MTSDDQNNFDDLNDLKQDSNQKTVKETSRVFYAICFRSEQCDQLAELRDILVESSSKGSFTATKNMHLTVLFIGNVEEERLRSMVEQLHTLRFPRFTLVFDHIGRFAKRSGDVMWVGLRENQSDVEVLQTLYGNVCDAAMFDGLDSASYTPHITLGRNVKLYDETSISKVNEVLAKHPFVVQVSEVHLMRSHRVNGELIYSSLASKESTSI